MEQLEISLEKLFESIRRAAENIGSYDSYSDMLTLLPDQKEEFNDIVIQTTDDFLVKIFDGEDEEEIEEFDDDDDDVFLLSDEEDEDPDDDDDDDDNF